jgi:lipopolysaccharide/colanic/teichoic acid biosynthesis glycosyltransferase
MVLLMWLVGCLLVAALSAADGPWLLGFGAVMAAQCALWAGRTTRLPAAAGWIAAVACVALAGVGYDGADRFVYLGVGALLLVLADRFAAHWIGLSAFLMPGGRPPDPIARDFARVRRERSSLTVASISTGRPRQASRRLAQVARTLAPYLRLTDAVVRVAADSVVVILPGADDRRAMAVLQRLPEHERADLLLGTATFPDDGQTYALLKEVARSRQGQWWSGGGPTSNGRAPRAPQPAAATADDRAAVLFETRTLRAPIRRAGDLVVLTLIAPIVVPVVALLAIAVRLDSPGPAFVRITRLGRDGRPFGLLKLRSMSRDAEAMKEALRHLNTMAWPDFKIADDPRVTRLGRVLRKSSLDELPQLYNVLRGEMTLVGPRPCSVKLTDYDLWQSERLDVTPGLVGRWQAEGRGSMDFAERCRLDIHQARSTSIRVNLRLLVATARSVFTSKGAY